MISTRVNHDKMIWIKYNCNCQIPIKKDEIKIEFDDLVKSKLTLIQLAWIERIFDIEFNVKIKG